MRLVKTVAVLVLAACAAWVRGAYAEYPEKPIKIIVPFAPGGIADNTARVIAHGLSTRLKQPVIVENRPGGAAVIGIQSVAKAPADGYTLLLGSTNVSTNPSLYKSLPYDTHKELTPVALVMLLPAALIVPDSFPVRSLKELLTYAAENPNKVNYSSVGLGSYPHLAIENLTQLTDTQMTPCSLQGICACYAGSVVGRGRLVSQ